MLVLAVDLAERYSAAVLLADGKVAAESTVDFGDRRDPWIEKCRRVRRFWDSIRDELASQIEDTGDAAYRIIIEDVYPFASQPKWVYRIQGYLMLLIEEDGMSYEWCLPLRWQRHFGYKKEVGRTSKVWAKELARAHGYVPDAHGKARIDLQDAFLLALWGWEDYAERSNASGSGSVEVTN